MRLIPDEDIPWIVRLLAEQNSFAFIAEEWQCSEAHVRKRLKEHGVVLRMIGIPPGMPITNLKALQDGLGHVDRPHALVSCKRRHLVVLPMTEHLAMVKRLAELEAKHG